MNRSTALNLLAILAACRPEALPSSEPAPVARAEPPKPSPPAPRGEALSEPALLPGVLRRLGSGLIPRWDPALAVDVGCNGTCYVTAGLHLEIAWDSGSGRPQWVRQRSDKLWEPQIVRGRLRYVDEDGCLWHDDDDDDDELGCLPERVQPSSVGCNIDPGRIAQDIAECEQNEYCDSLPYEEDEPLGLMQSKAAATVPRVLATFTCLDETQHRIGVFDVATDRQLAPQVLAPTNDPWLRRAEHVAISDDGRRVAFNQGSSWKVVDVDEDTVLFDVPPGTTTNRDYPRAHFSPDGSRLSIVEGEAVTVLSIDEQRVLYQSRGIKPKCYVPAYDLTYLDAFVEFVGDDRLLVFQADARLQLVAVATGEVEFETGVCATSAWLDPSGRQLVVGTRRTAEPLRYRLPSAEPLPPVLPDAPPRTAKAVAISSDGRIAVSMLSDSVAWVWDVSTGAVLQRLERSSGGTQIRPSVELSPDGSRLASSHQIASLWDVGTGEYVAKLDGDFHSLALDRFVFSKDGSLLVAVTSRRINVWDGRTGAALHRIELPGTYVYDLEFLDGARLVAVDQAHALLIDAREGKQIHRVALATAGCKGFCQDYERTRLHPVGADAFIAASVDEPRRHDRIEVVAGQLHVAPTDPPPPGASAPRFLVEPWAVASAAKTAVSRDPYSTALLVWPYPWPTPADDNSAK